MRQRADKLGPGVLLALAAEAVANEWNVEFPEPDKTAARALREINGNVQGQWVDPEPDYGDGDGGEWVPGILQEPPHTWRVDNLGEAIVFLGKQLKRRIVMLFDGLDRLSDTTLFPALVNEDLRHMRLAGLGAVIIGPPHLRWRQERHVQDMFTEFHLHGATNVGGAGTGFLSAILRKRSSEEMLPNEACEELASWSGGVIRDLIALARLAGESAYGAGSDSVRVQDVRKAADQYGRTMLLGASQEMAKRLGELVPRTWPGPRSLSFVLGTDIDMSLLLSRLLIEVPGTPVRYIPHPVVVPHLQRMH